MISDPFCVVAPHADTFDQQGITIEFIAALPTWMASRTAATNRVTSELPVSRQKAAPIAIETSRLSKRTSVSKIGGVAL